MCAYYLILDLYVKFKKMFTFIFLNIFHQNSHKIYQVTIILDLNCQMMVLMMRSWAAMLLMMPLVMLVLMILVKLRS